MADVKSFGMSHVDALDQDTWLNKIKGNQLKQADLENDC